MDWLPGASIQRLATGAVGVVEPGDGELLAGLGPVARAVGESGAASWHSSRSAVGGPPAASPGEMPASRSMMSTAASGLASTIAAALGGPFFPGGGSGGRERLDHEVVAWRRRRPKSPCCCESRARHLLVSIRSTKRSITCARPILLPGRAGALTTTLDGGADNRPRSAAPTRADVVAAVALADAALLTSYSDARHPADSPSRWTGRCEGRGQRATDAAGGLRSGQHPAAA